MTPATTTTITGVTILTKKPPRRLDVFDITLSHEGIDIKRPGRGEQRLSWDRISQWEIAEQADYVVLTLRGDGAVTPLVVKGWTLDDLEVVMRDVTSSVTGPIPSRTLPAAPLPQPSAPAEPATNAGPGPAPAEAPVSGGQPEPDQPPTAPRESRSARRARRRESRRPRPTGLGWKPVVTVVLLCALVTAVTLVLLQSAGVISWGFLGPTA